MYCRNCGSEIMQGGGFCGKCGAAISLSVSSNELEPQKISRWKKCAYIYGIVALIVFALKLFGIFPQFYKEGDHWTVKYRGLTELSKSTENRRE